MLARCRFVPAIRQFSFPAAGLGLALAGCQAVPPAADPARVAPPPPTDRAGLPSDLTCASNLMGTLRNGVRVNYQGRDDNDADLCRLDWSGRSHSLYFGFWSAYGHVPLAPKARTAFRTALTGPVGTETTFDEHHARLWNRVTVTHTANTTVTVSGVPRPVVELRVVQHDATGRPGVHAENRYRIDRVTGALLSSKVVTPMANGKQMTSTTWQIDLLDRSG